MTGRDVWRVEVVDDGGVVLERWWTASTKAAGFAAAQQVAHPRCTVRLVALPPAVPMVTPGGEPW